MKFLRIQFNDKQTGQKDILLSILGKQWTKRVDSFYFLAEASPSSTDQVLGRLANLLNWWRNKVDAIELNQTIYLPIDFSDEYLGCFQVKVLENNMLELNFGFAKGITGKSFPPSNPGNFGMQEIEFIPDTRPCLFYISKEEFLASIYAN